MLLVAKRDAIQVAASEKRSAEKPISASNETIGGAPAIGMISYLVRCQVLRCLGKGK